MSEDKKKYICKLPTNGHNAGDEVFLTDSEVANFNGGEELPRFVLAEEVGAADVPVDETPKQEETPAAETPADAPQEVPATPTPEGEYVPEDPKPETTPAEGSETTTPPSTEGVQ